MSFCFVDLDSTCMIYVDILIFILATLILFSVVVSKLGVVPVLSKVLLSVANYSVIA